MSAFVAYNPSSAASRLCRKRNPSCRVVEGGVESLRELIFKTVSETYHNRYDFDNFWRPCVQLPTATVLNRKTAIVLKSNFARSECENPIIRESNNTGIQ